MEESRTYNGIINVLKPPGMSSSGVVVFLKGLLGYKRIGHAGTLDPGAAGVLCVALGRSARLSELLMEREKEYIAQCTFGCATDTLDSYGSVTERRACHVTKEQLESALEGFRGEIMQVPPAYSAVKIDGTESYKLARKGRQIASKPPRRAVIYALELIGQTGEDSFLLKVRCSKGTYIRVLIEDIAGELGVPAYMSFLLRTCSGGQRIETAYTIDELKEMKARGDMSFIIPPQDALKGMKRIDVGELTAQRLKNGLTQRVKAPCEGDFTVYCSGELIGIARKCEEGIKLRISLY